MISMIVATGQNKEIGANNELLWSLPNDMMHFVKKTKGKTIVMGRKTFESLPRVLPNRKHIILSKSGFEFEHEDVRVVNDFNKLLIELQETDEEVVIIGGERIYKLFVPYIDKLYVTVVHESFPEADTFFPDIDFHCEVVSKEFLQKDDLNQYDHTIYECCRIQ